MEKVFRIAGLGCFAYSFGLGDKGRLSHALSN
jgi:hypothetical protein